LNLQCVIWDMDGTLIDSTQFHFLAWKNTLATFFKLDLEEKSFLNIYGMTNNDILSNCVHDNISKSRKNEIFLYKEKKFRDLIKGQIKFMPGAKYWLEQFDSFGILQVLASSAPMENIQAVIWELKLEKIYTTVISGDKLLSKPSPEIYFAVLKTIRRNISGCLAIDDSWVGVQAARNIHMKVIGVGRYLHKMKPDIYVSDLTELSILTIEECFNN